MATADKVLIAGGVLNIAYGMLLGFAIVVIRTRGFATTPRYLHAAHIGTMLQAGVLLGLAWAVQLSPLGSGWEQLAAWLLVIASGLVAVMDTANWIGGVSDAFAEGSKSAVLGGLAGTADAIAAVILVVGVIKDL